MKRILILTLILCGCFVSVAPGQQQQCAFSPLWAQFHKYNMRRWNHCENILGVDNVGNLVLKWSYATGNSVRSSPAVTNGVVYIGSDDGEVYALNASTGALLWTYTAGAGIFSSPAVASGMVYVGSLDYKVYALNAKTGSKLWSYSTGGGYSSPVVVNGMVYVGGGSSVYAFGLK